MTSDDRPGVGTDGLGRSTSVPFRIAVTFGAAGTASVAVAGLLGYVPGLRVLGSLRPDYIPMAPSTAICFVILSMVLWRGARQPWKGSGLIAMAALVLLVTVFSLLDLVGEFAGTALNFEGAVAPAAGTLGGVPVGRMSPATGAAFSLAGSATFLWLLQSRRSRHARRLGHWASSLGTLTVLFGATVLLAYVYRTPLMYGGATIPMAATTSLAFLFLGTALVAAGGPDAGPMRYLAGDSTAARLSRVFLPLMVAVVLLQSVVSRLQEAFFAVNDALIVAGLVVVVAVVTASVVTRVAHSLGSSLDELNDRLRESEERLRAIVEGTSDAIYVKDLKGRYILFNSAASRFVGVEPIAVIGRDDTALFPPDEARTMMETDREVMAGGRTRIYEEVMTTATGLATTFLSAKGPVLDGAGNVVGLFGVARDITDRKRAEEEKIRLEGQLQRAQKMKSVGRLAGGVAHEFNNMLGVILGYTEMALEQVDSAQPLHADLVEIRKAATRSADVTRQLLAFARQQIIEPRVLDLNEIVASSLTMLGRLIGEDIHLTSKPAADLWPTKVDASQMGQMLSTLCLNARDAISGTGHLTIETANSIIDQADCAVHRECVPGQYVLLTVTDDGCGMDSATLATLFEPFFTTKDVGQGTGLGLATVYGMARQNGGFVTVSSELGVGTTFRIYLPRHTGEPVEAPAPAASDLPTARDETILLVEDEQAVLELTADMLKRLGYTVLTAGAPEEAIRLAREHAGQIHLLLTDVMMPEMNGQDLLTRVVALRPAVSSLFMSGYPADIVAQRGVPKGDERFIRKPFSKRDLAVKVRQALDREGESLT